MTTEDQLLAELLAIKNLALGLDKKIDLQQHILDDITKMVEAHEQTLYRHNGVKGLLARVDAIEEEHNEEKREKEKERDERRKMRYALIGGTALVLIDLILGLLNIA